MTHINNSNNQQYMNSILQSHFNNINVLANTIQSSQEIITQMQHENTMNNTRANNIRDTIFNSIFSDDINVTSAPRPRRNSNLNNDDINSNTTNTQEDNDNLTYYFTFDTLNASSLNNTNLYTSSISFDTILITDDNKNIINDVSNNVDVDNSQNTDQCHLYEISHFDLIQHPLNDVCPITRERFDSTSEHILMIKKCKHIFNKSALNIWLEQNNTCPCCRGRIR